MRIRNLDSSFVWLHRVLDIAVPFALLYLIAMTYGIFWHDRYIVMGLIGGLSLIFFNQATGVYTGWRGRSLFAGFKLILQAWGLTWMFLIVFAFMLKDGASFSRVTVTAWALITPIGLLAYRIVIRAILGRLRAQGWSTRRVAIVGAGQLGQRIAKTLNESKMLGYNPVAFYDDRSGLTGTKVEGIPVVGTIDHLLACRLLEEQYDEIHIALPMRAEARIKTILNALADSSITVKFIPDFFSFDLLHSRLSDIGGIPIISVYDSPLNSPGNALVKRLEDIILSTIILVLISPLLIFLALGVKLSSPGPVFYKQVRVGWNGKNFNMLKFRSMPVDAEKEGVQWGGSKSKTTSKFGAFIRKTSLDELPQFFNVLKGDMSIVGPRPERDVFVVEFRKKIPRYMQKHMVKAGITGWAQIHGWRGDTSLKRRIKFDLHYIDNWSLWLDLRIIALTFIKGFINKNAY
ncbi:undecaprenyl-phosphate glucose phosphotransferase [Thiohalomonas denitrificans]|uniref:Putative colanic acid biosysnthesis UDP-glucose lipid carrier transferase n=1 Tax=Thiohalomonas denitrificans TaxID=415747 RepID=A0A1G5R203_9GAMM|nr:undecaprenyl-phosphate glucose phosphotransferase [Thiohalomonas denitrificans]SCZ67359.1 putative colanic acid biosysnthesis UDP-glucose lipid carrier transferase [Thiohalomonas denitrificans]